MRRNGLLSLASREHRPVFVLSRRVLVVSEASVNICCKAKPGSIEKAIRKSNALWKDVRSITMAFILRGFYVVSYAEGFGNVRAESCLSECVPQNAP
jgi:hypothetical protein